MRTKILGSALAMLLLALVGTVHITDPVGAAVTTCSDGRGWTRDVVRNGECQHVHICVPDVNLEILRGRISWAWVFPDACPMASISAVGVLVEHRVAKASSGDLALGTVARIDTAGTAAPPRRGGGSLTMTCGPVELDLTVISGHEIVATASGYVTTSTCSGPGSPTDPLGPTVPGMLGRWDGSTGSVATLARLYWAVFGRQPDNDGFSYWMARLDGGLSFRDAATIWTNLPEWTATFSGTDNPAFVERIYRNVLGRRPEQTGLEYWTGRLDQGLPRSELVLLVSDAPEFRQRTNTK